MDRSSIHGHAGAKRQPALVHFQLAGAVARGMVHDADLSAEWRPELEWSVSVERADATHCTYWLTVKNLTTNQITFEGRFAVLN